MRTDSNLSRKSTGDHPKKGDKERDYPCHHQGKIYVVGIGNGTEEGLTIEAREILLRSEVIIGYKSYFKYLDELLRGKELIVSSMGEEVKRARFAIDLAEKGRVVAVISSGDPGIYGMAGLLLEIMAKEERALYIKIIPGVPASTLANAALGSPLALDYAVISLSDILIPLEVIFQRLEAIAKADLVLVLYNPKSSKRVEVLIKSRDILLKYRSPETIVGIVTDAQRPGQKVVTTTLDLFLGEEITMSSIIVVGNSSTFQYQDFIITPRGYQL